MSEDALAAEAKQLAKVLTKLGKLPTDLGAKAFTKVLGDYDASISALRALNKQRTSLVNDKNAHSRALKVLIARVRAATKGIYGADSNEYELVGGRRQSERKKPKKKAPAAK